MESTSLIENIRTRNRSTAKSCIGTAPARYGWASPEVGLTPTLICSYVGFANLQAALHSLHTYMVFKSKRLQKVDFRQKFERSAPPTGPWRWPGRLGLPLLPRVGIAPHRFCKLAWICRLFGTQNLQQSFHQQNSVSWNRYTTKFVLGATGKGKRHFPTLFKQNLYVHCA